MKILPLLYQESNPQWQSPLNSRGFVSGVPQIARDNKNYQET
jgi:hypothetical protein